MRICTAGPSGSGKLAMAAAVATALLAWPAVAAAGPEIAVEPSSYTFPDTAVGTSSAAKEFTVRNSGDADLTIEDYNTVGLGCSHFVFSFPTGIETLAPGDTTTFTGTFEPSDVGTHSCTVVILSDADNDTTYGVPLEGTGTSAEITLVEPAGGSIDFGDVEVGGASGDATITVRSDGSSALTIDAVSLAGANAGHFAITSGPIPGPDIVLANGETESWTVRCEPNSRGNKSALFRISNDDADEDPLDVSLSCRGTVAELSATPAPLQFPETRVGESSQESITLENTGNVSLEVVSLSLSDNVFAFINPPSTPFNLGPGDTQVVEVSFTPVANGDVNGSLTVDATELDSPETFSVIGPGRVAELDVSPVSHDFGKVRVDQPFDQTQTFTITNTGTADFEYTDITIDNATDFQLTAVDAPQLTLSPSDTATFEVKATPDAIGMNDGQVTITTDIPGSAATVLVDVTVEGVAPGIRLSSMMLDFGNKDIQAGPAVESVMVENDGSADLVISALAIDGSDNFSVDSSGLPITLAPGDTAQIEVTYDPQVANAGEPETDLVITSDAHPVGTMNVRVTGRGVDRDINLVTQSIEFPATFRHPEQPALETIRIENLGLAPLELSMAVTEGPGSDSFRVMDSIPFTIDGDSASDVTVAFAPTSANSSPLEATLVISNDDTDEPMVQVPLSGLGVLPDIQVTPGDIDIGTTGVGVPLTLPDRIEIINNDDAELLVREVVLADSQGNPVSDDTFRLIGFDESQELPVDGRVALDVEFTPTEVGEFDAVVEVYMNADPERVAFVTVRGEAVEVKARGGGCRAGPGAGLDTLAWASAALLLLLALPSRRRRRAVRARRVLGGGLLVLILLIGARPLAADDDLDLTTFRPTPQTEPAMLGVETPGVGEPGAWALGFYFDHAANPLRFESPQRPDMEDVPVTGRTAARLAFAYAFAGRFEAGFVVPFLQQTGDAPMFSGVQPADDTALGDVDLHTRALLIGGGPLSVGASVTVTIPSATGGQFAGAAGPAGHARGIVGLEVGPVDVAANGGFRVRDGGELADVEQGNEITYGLGASYRLARSLRAIGELYGALGMTGGATEGVSPLEASLGIRWRATRMLDVGAGVGRGILPGIGAPDVRGVLLVSLSPRARAPEALPTEPPPEVAAATDDEVIDEPVAEVERDGDGDGIPDVDDLCPDEAEDVDGYNDGDGCPDPDNDGDGIPDADDQCPDEPEDEDGYADEDGCDDPDNDGDGIPDVIDQCAIEPETINGNEDEDGCPDEGESLVMVMPDRIELFEPVRFRRGTADILPRSRNVLGQVAATLRASPEILRIRIGSHVHPRGNATRERELSQKRAETVREWLIDFGIEPERLEVKGYGSSQPLVSRRKKGAAGMNDRVEFVLLEKRVEDESP